jgi:hypothetical protein
MQHYEYRVLPAPNRGAKVKGLRTPEDRFAHALMTLMNEMGREGWEYLRADTLPCEERVGLTGRTTRFRTLLVFRRATAAAAAARAGAVEAAAAPLVPPTIADAEALAALPAANAPAPPNAPSAAAPRAEPPPPGGAGLSAGRLAATLTARAPEGPAPKLAPVAGPGAAPRIGAARGKGLSRPGDPGWAAG